MSLPSFNELKPLFKDALCPGEIGFTPQGYLTPCFCNTYIFSPLVIVLVVWALSEMHGLATDDHRPNSLTGRIKFATTAAYLWAVVKLGPNVFNIVSLTVSMLSLLIVFVLSFLDLKGVYVPQKPLELYFFVAAAVTGYLVVEYIGLKTYGQNTRSTLFVCLIASLGGSIRDIVSAFDEAERQAKKAVLRK